MRSLKSRLAHLERQPALVPQCTCPGLTEHYELADGSIVPPIPPCLHPSGKCPAPDPKRIRHIIITIPQSPAGAVETGSGDDGQLLPDDEFFMVASEIRVIVWRDERGKLCYYGPPRWWERLTPGRMIKGPRVPETVEEIVAELRRDDDWSGRVLGPAPQE